MAECSKDAYHTDAITKKMQIKEISMLKKLASVFEEKGITFFLACGTSLGCARHKGFIPWDDDIDIYVFGRDYEKIKSVFGDGAIDNLEFQDYSITRDYPYPYPKIVATDTILVEDSLKHLSYRCGVYIDVFPLVEVSNNRFARFISEAVRYFRYCELKAYYFKFSGPKKILNFFARIFVKPNRVHKRLCNQYSSKRNNPLFLVDAGAFGKQALLKAHCFEEIEMMPFEKTLMPMAKGYKDYLTHYYGDYMVLPEESQRVARHHIRELAIEGEKIV